MSRPKSHKRDREKARKERAEIKAARRVERRSVAEQDAAPVTEADQADVLVALAELHRRFAAEEIEFEEFDAAKRELTQQLDVH